MSDAVVIGVVGIVVSGVAGPWVSARLARRSAAATFGREERARDRAGLRVLLDEAAQLLAMGGTNLRILRTPGSDAEPTKRAEQWHSAIFPTGQRLELWLPPDHAVVVAYDEVRLLLIEVASTTDESRTEDAVVRFEAARSRFLEAARAVLTPTNGEDK